MNRHESIESEAVPSLDELRRITGPVRAASLGDDASREVFLALGQSVEAAASDFDWRRVAAMLEAEVAAKVDRPQPLRVAPRRRSMAPVAIASAALLLVAVTIGLVSSAPQKPKRDFAGATLKPGPVEKEAVKGIDSWERSSGIADAAWQDEIDVELAATRRELRRGRDPWVSDEPVLFEVLAQLGDLNAGLVFEPF